MGKSSKNSNPKSNDAIPSWSGFNYQGKMTLLCSLILLNEIQSKNQNPEDYFVELEKTEDFIFYKGSTPLKLYQSKAKLGDDMYYDYYAACKKLLEHRDLLKAPSAICYLITSISVHWDTEKNKYNGIIELFSYNGSVVEILQVPDSIKEQIKCYMDQCNYKTTYHVEYIYQALCLLIDEKVALFHKKGSSCDYKISFKDIQDCILTSARRDERNIRAVLKEQVYIHIGKSIYKALENCCKDHCDGQTLQKCEENCGAKKHYEDLASLDLWNYIHIINPDHSEWDTDMLDHVEYTNKDAYQGLIFNVFSRRDADCVCFNGSNSVLKNVILHDLPGWEIVPTLLSVYGDRENRKRNLQSKLKSINENGSIHPFIEGRILSADTGGIESSLIEGKVTYFNEEKRPKVSDMNMDTIIVDIQTLVDGMEESQ